MYHQMEKVIPNEDVSGSPKCTERGKTSLMFVTYQVSKVSSGEVQCRFLVTARYQPVPPLPGNAGLLSLLLKAVGFSKSAFCHPCGPGQLLLTALQLLLTDSSSFCGLFCSRGSIGLIILIEVNLALEVSLGGWCCLGVAVEVARQTLDAGAGNGAGIGAGICSLQPCRCTGEQESLGVP